MPIKTWANHHQQKAKVVSLAKKYKNADHKLEEVSGSSNAWEYTVRGYKTPTEANTPEGTAAGQALETLVAYHKHLVRDLGLDHYMVRRAWTGILNPKELA